MSRSSQLQRSFSGFTLVEVAIVLAVIGLLIGGITGGQYMLQQSQLQSVVKDLEKFKAAYWSFKEQYGGLPSDITNAESYWGTDTADGCVYPATGSRLPKKATCNGDGNNQIVGSGYIEYFRSWQHLANAGMVEGTYSGVSGSSNFQHHIFGTNSPGSKLRRSGYAMLYMAPVTSGTNYFWGTYGTVISYGATSAGYPRTGGLKPLEALMFDEKLDNGKPGFGSFRAYASTQNPSCTTSDTVATSTYAITDGALRCGFMYIIDETSG